MFVILHSDVTYVQYVSETPTTNVSSSLGDFWNMASFQNSKIRKGHELSSW